MPIDFTKYGKIVEPTNNSKIDFSKYGTPIETAQTPEPEKKTGFLGNLVKAPLTTIARPIQAIAELAGAKSEDVDRVTSKITGGLVAPVPQNFGDVKKDVGRATQTVALGLNPVAGGALFGAGNSLEQGNDLLSTQTAFQTALGGAGGKVLNLVGKPLLNGAGKIVGKITPQILKDVAGKGAGAITEFASTHNILPKETSNLINKGASNVNKLADKSFEVGANFIKDTGTKAKEIYNKQYPTSINEDKFTKAKENISNQYRKVLPFSPSEKAKEGMLLQKTGDDTSSTLAKHGINLGSEEAPFQLQEISDQFRNATQHAQQNEHAYFNVNEIKQNAFNEIDNNLSSETERITAKKQVGDEIDALLKKNKSEVIDGENGEKKITANLQERLRKTGNSWGQYNKFNPNTIKNASGRSLANAVRDQVEKEGTFPAYREANREWSKIIHAQEILRKFDVSGKTFKTLGGLSGSVSRKILSGTLGYHAGGIGGAILAEIGSEYGAKILANPELRTYFDRKIIEKFAGKNPTPKAIQELEKQIKDYIDRQGNLLKLPTPSYIPMGGKTPSRSGVELVSAKKNPVSINPKTGKFQTTYNSSYENVETAPITTQSKIIPSKTIISKTLPRPNQKSKLPTKPPKLGK